MPCTDQLQCSLKAEKNFQPVSGILNMFLTPVTSFEIWFYVNDVQGFSAHLNTMQLDNCLMVTRINPCKCECRHQRSFAYPFLLLGSSCPSSNWCLLGKWSLKWWYDNDDGIINPDMFIYYWRCRRWWSVGCGRYTWDAVVWKWHEWMVKPWILVNRGGNLKAVYLFNCR